MAKFRTFVNQKITDGEFTVFEAPQTPSGWAQAIGANQAATVILQELWRVGRKNVDDTGPRILQDDDPPHVGTFPEDGDATSEGVSTLPVAEGEKMACIVTAAEFQGSNLYVAVGNLAVEGDAERLVGANAASLVLCAELRRRGIIGNFAVLVRALVPGPNP